MTITLEQLLASRDNRARHQKDLLGEHPGKSLLCLTVQLPGPEKKNALSGAIARAGVEAVRRVFPLEYEELRDLETVFEGFFIVPMPPEAAKRLACKIEDTHPLGRLMDLDVPGWDRASIGLPPRRCLLCGNEVRYCMRARTHSREDLLYRMETMVQTYELQAHDTRAYQREGSPGQRIDRQPE